MGKLKLRSHRENSEFWCFDAEIYINYAYFKFENYKTDDVREFRIYEEGSVYDRNDVLKLIDFCVGMNKYLIGYNSYEYDNQLLNYLCKTKRIASFPVKRLTETLKKISDNIILNDYNAHKYDRYFSKIDLKRVANLEKSLKYCEMNLRMNLIQDLPIMPHMRILPDQVPIIEDYCGNDVKATKNMAIALRQELLCRWNVEGTYGVPALNESNSTMANKLFTQMYSKASGLRQKEFIDLRSPIEKIAIKDVLLDVIEFKDPKLIAYLDSIKDIEIDCTAEKITIDLPILSYGKCDFSFGAGGLHSVDKGAHYSSTDEVSIMDADVSSYYPAIIILFKLFPEHLGEIFIEVLRYIRDSRIEFKTAGDVVNSYIFKIIINSIFGKMGSKHSFLYSPKRMLQTTLNGQFCLIMLVEMLEMAKFEVISANTDGVTAIVPNSRKDEYMGICKEWEKKTGFDLDYVKYIEYVRLNVNNYLASYMEKDKLKIKRKGKVINKDIYKDLTKSYYMPVVAAAVENYYINGGNVKEFILNHDDPMDFYIGASVGKKFTVRYSNHDTSEIVQNTLRYYISNSGYRLTKEYNGSVKSIVAGHNVRLALNHDPDKPIDSYDIKYNYYIGEAYKWIKQIEKEHKANMAKHRETYVQQTLF